MPMGMGALVRVQVTKTINREGGGAVEQYDVALTSLQLRALGEDLVRAANEDEGRPSPAKRKWWRV